MIIFPYGTDAPIYHWPITTVVLIVVNVCAFVALASRAVERAEIDPAALAALAQAPGEEIDEEIDGDAGADGANFEIVEIDPGELDPAEHDVQLDEFFANPYEQAIDPFILHYGQGLRPWEWLTSNFMHADFLHLLGNMFGLWGLGLIIEGKVGWWRFLLMYLGIGATQSGLEQTLMLSSSGVSLGASAIVFGMIVIAVLWAPKNDLYCAGWLGLRGGLFELSISTYAAIMVGLELVLLVITSFSFSAAWLHLMGAVLGAGLGLVMLKLRWVDCESWDLFSVWKDQQGVRDVWAPDPKKQKPDPDVVEQSPEDRRSMALTQIQQLIEQGQPQLAYAAHQRMSSKLAGWDLPADDFRKLIAAYQKLNLWSDSLPLMVEYLRKHAQRAAHVRLNLAKVLIQHERRPAQALRVMGKIPAAELDETLSQLRAQLERAAKQQQDEGEVEMATEDW
jgi:membrane associated rhomboid family serine protease